MQANDENTSDEPIDLLHFHEPLLSVTFTNTNTSDNTQQEGVHLRTIGELDIKQGKRISLDSGQLMAVSALLKEVPTLVQSGYLAGKPLYELTFGPNVLNTMTTIMQAKGGGFRAIAVNQHGKIIGHGVLHPAHALRATAAISAVWHVMAIVTAQAYLSEINSRLANIEQGINEIRVWLEAAQFSKIDSAMRYVRG